MHRTAKLWKYYDDLYFSANRPRPDQTTKNSDPAKIRNIGGQKQRPRGIFFGAQGLNFAVLQLTLPLLERQEQSTLIKGQR